MKAHEERQHKQCEGKAKAKRAEEMQTKADKAKADQKEALEKAEAQEKGRKVFKIGHQLLMIRAGGGTTLEEKAEAQEKDRRGVMRGRKSAVR